MKLQQKNKKPVKVPVIMQMEALECGAASLAMVLAYFNKWVPIEQVRSDCGVSRDGTTAGQIYRSAERYGLRVSARRYSVKQIQEISFYPSIIHWNFNHFVVLRGFKGSTALINDPARGAVSVPLKEFDESFTGVCLEFSPGDTFAPGGKPRSIGGFIKSRLKGSLSSVIFVMLAWLLTSITGILTPTFDRVFSDEILSGNNQNWLIPLTISMLALMAFVLLTEGLKAIYMLKIKGKLSIVSNASFLWHTLHLPMTFFSQRMAGDLAGRQASNDDVADTLVSKIAPVLLNLIMLILYLIVMLRYNVILALVGIATIGLNLVVARFLTQKRVNITRAQMRDQGKLRAATVSGIEMIETIKAAGAENGFFERWAGFHASVNKSKVASAYAEGFLGAMPTLLREISKILILSIAAWLILDDHFTIGMLLAFQGFMTMFLQPARELITTGQSMQEIRTSMERIEDVMRYPADVPEIDIPQTTTEYRKLTGRIEMRNVTFGYTSMGKPQIIDFNLTLEPGQRVAFVGASGSGKSTLVKLLSGLYQPWSGEILFDGQPISAIPREVFTGSVAVVDQEVILFEDTINNNLKMWDSSIENYEVILAARDAQIHADIVQREGGYSHRLLEGGKDFSGGQRQRMEITRVLAQDPTIVLMDEATSALDARTEFNVVESIANRGVTCIIVAHRLSTIRDCDEIIVMDRGKVVERGNHQSLLASGGLYTKLISAD
ncbi:MAG: NHLP family bacteriocin export ABC transporter peptidase/permease/ATPase subunit [Flexilinea flocculi]|nr:NHLP family bacteriocin export ABC transporter peptidase/permease/ATPase subunit [Flexilinea flocculi]